MVSTLLYIGEDQNVARVLTQVITQDLRCDLVHAYDMAEGVVAAQDHEFRWVLVEAVTDYDTALMTVRLLRARRAAFAFSCMVIVGRHVSTPDLIALLDAGADDFVSFNMLHLPGFANALRRR